MYEDTPGFGGRGIAPFLSKIVDDLKDIVKRHEYIIRKKEKASVSD